MTARLAVGVASHVKVGLEVYLLAVTGQPGEAAREVTGPIFT